MKTIQYFLLRIYIKLYRYLYWKISNLSTILNDGIHPKHKIMDYHKFFVENIDENSSILDVGCGIGTLSFDLAEKVRKVTAVDQSKNSIEFAKKHFFRNNIVYINADATKYDFNEVYDYVVLSNVLEHIKNRIDFLIDLKKHSNVFLIRVPMIDRSWLSLYIKKLGMDYRLDATHYIEYTLETFKKELELAGLKTESYSIQFGEIWAKIIRK